MLDLGEWERRERTKNRRRLATLPCERGLPPIDATAEQLIAYQERMLGRNAA